MNVKEITAKTILRKHKKIDSWFLSIYGMNLYRGCSHNCVYCDGRFERYNVDENFGEDVYIKINALDILKKELSSTIRRKTLKKGYILVGGGVGDSYQSIEKEYEITRKTLKLLYEKGFPVHILTKSTLVERDTDILKRINEKNRAIVSFSFSSTDEKISSIFEPGVPSPKKRLDCLRNFKEEGIAIGMFLMPVIPFITDKPEIIEKSIQDAKKIDIDFIIFSGMTLKPGRQMNHFYNVLNYYYPHLIIDYKTIYKGDKWGGAIKKYYDSINETFNNLTKKYQVSKRIPKYLFNELLDANDRVIVLLEHIDYLLKLKGIRSPYGYAAYSISNLKEPLSYLKNNLTKIRGVGKTTERIILEILDTGTSRYYEKLMKN